MKIYKYIGVALMVLSLGACKTDDLERDIDALKDRVTAMEAKVDRLNESMNMIRVALDGNKTIQSYTENEDGSYTLTLSDGNTITLTQGKTGATDVYQEVSISTDGNWVIGGVETEHRAVAVDGVPGVTPQFRLTMESEGKYYWEVSYDGELTWEEVKSQQGTRVYASASGSSSVAGPIASAVPNATRDKFEITLTGSGTKYEIPIVPGLACDIKEPNPEDMENGYWIVPTNTGATTSIDLKGEAVLISAPEGWTVTAEIGNGTLTIIPPAQDGAEGIITLQVNKGIYWAIDQIKVRSKKVITSWYQEFLAGAEIVVNDDVKIKKGSADNKVVINEKEVDLKVSLISDDNAEIAEDGLYFIEAGLNVTYKNSQNKNKVLINDSPTGKKPVVTCTNTITLNGTSLICKNVALKLVDGADYRFLTINTNSAPIVAFDGCNLEAVPSSSGKSIGFLYASATAGIKNFSFCKSKFILNYSGTNDYIFISIATNDLTFDKIFIDNSIFCGNYSKFKLFGVNNSNGTKAGIGSLVLYNNTFINVHYHTAGLVNGDISSLKVEKNIIFADNNTNSVTIFRKRGGAGSKDSGVDFSKDPIVANDGSIVDNIGYINYENNDGPCYLNLWYGNTPPLDNAKNIRSLDASPFETLDKSTGTYVLKPEYQGYGATIE